VTVQGAECKMKQAWTTEKTMVMAGTQEEKSFMPSSQNADRGGSI